MAQFNMTTIIKKLQDLSRNRHFLISEVEKVTTNAESDGINTSVFFIYLYFISNVRVT